MTNLTGEYDVAVEVSVALLNRVLAVLHENQDPGFLALPHSMTLFVDDTSQGTGDPVPEAERTGFQAGVEVQVSAPTLSLPQGGGQVADGLAWAVRLPAPWTPPKPPDVNISAVVRAWVEGTPQPSVPEFIHGTMIVSADIARTSIGTVGTAPTALAAGPPLGGIGSGGVFPPGVETFLGIDRTSLGVFFQPAQGTAVPSDEQRRIEQISRNLLRTNLRPLTFQISVPANVARWDYKLDPDHASIMAAFILTGRTPAAKAIDDLPRGWLPPGADFAIAVGRDYILNNILSVLRAQLLRSAPSKYTASWGWPVDVVSGEARPDWSASGFDLETGQVVFSVAGDGDISYAGIDDGFSFTIRLGFTLDVAGGVLGLRAAGDPEVDLSDVAIGTDTLRDSIRDAVRGARDQALAAARDQIRDALRVQRPIEEILARIQPAPPGVILTGVAIHREGIIVSGATGLAPSAPVVVRQVRRRTMIDALDSWIPGGTIERFRWYQSRPVAAPLMLEGIAGPTVSGLIEAHQFVIDEASPGHTYAYSPVGCLEVQGTRVTPGGEVATVSGNTCGYFHPLLPWPIPRFPTKGSRAWPVLPIQGVRPDGRIGTVGHYSPWASGWAPRQGPTTLVVHFAEGDWEKTAAALQAALGKHPPEAALVVAILFGDGVLSELPQARIKANAAFVLGEDDGHWAEAFGVSKRPATVLVDAQGTTAWKEEGPLRPPRLAKALDEHAEKGGQVSWQPVRLGVMAGDEPPAFPFRLGRGAELSLEWLRGRQLVLTFWTSWCEPSIAQLREFAQATRDGEGTGPLVLAIGDGESADRAAEMAQDEDLPFPVLPDPDREISRRFGVGCWPSSVWISPAARVEAVNFGLTAVANRPA
jgi:peroxiredoxin